MTHETDIETLILAAHTLTRMAAVENRNETPAAQWRTIAILSELGPLRLGELATLSRVTQPGMTRLAGQMTAAGLLSRGADTADSRATVLSVTDAGRAAYRTWRAELTGALAPHFADLDEAEWEALRVTASVLARATALVEVAR